MAKGIDNNVMLCDNPISLDEIEKGLWLGKCDFSLYILNYIDAIVCHHGFIDWLHAHANELMLFISLKSISGSFTAATDIETLKQRNITHILTLDICPLPVHITELPFLTTKFIHGLFVGKQTQPFLFFYQINFPSLFQCRTHRKMIYWVISKIV